MPRSRRCQWNAPERRVTRGAVARRSKRRVGRVDHHLPHVVVGEERAEGAVAGEVPHRPRDDRVGIGERVGTDASPAVAVPALDLLGDESGERVVPCRVVEIERAVFCSLLDAVFDLRER